MEFQNRVLIPEEPKPGCKTTDIPELGFECMVVGLPYLVTLSPYRLDIVVSYCIVTIPQSPRRLKTHHFRLFRRFRRTAKVDVCTCFRRKA